MSDKVDSLACRASQGARGLKQTENLSLRNGKRRASQEARGLKLLHMWFNGELEVSCLARGAWIETMSCTIACAKSDVVPRKRRVD